MTMLSQTHIYINKIPQIISGTYQLHHHNVVHLHGYVPDIICGSAYCNTGTKFSGIKF